MFSPAFPCHRSGLTRQEPSRKCAESKLQAAIAARMAAWWPESGQVASSSVSHGGDPALQRWGGSGGEAAVPRFSCEGAGTNQERHAIQVSRWHWSSLPLWVNRVLLR